MSVSNRSLFRLTGPLLFIGITALSVIIAMSIWLNIRAQNYLEAVVEARDTRTAAVELRNAVQTADQPEGFPLYL